MVNARLAIVLSQEFSSEGLLFIPEYWDAGCGELLTWGPPNEIPNGSDILSN